MRFDRDFLTSPTGQVMLVAAVLALGTIAVRWQRQMRPTAALPAAKPAPSVPLPRTLIRDGARFVKPLSTTTTAPTLPISPAHAVTLAAQTRELPLALVTAPPPAPTERPAPSAPFGRLIPCATVVALESNRLETPIIGLVTEDVWHDGQRVIPAGAEVHGRAALDRTRERLGAQGAWRIVWRTQDADNGGELAVEGLALDRDYDPAAGVWGAHDGSAGLRGQIVKTADDRELKSFAATFLADATAALQDSRLTTGLLGQTSLPAATARNAVLAGAGAVLREQAQAMREAIARDGFYLRVPAGKPFYLYVTQTLNRSQAKTPPALAQLDPRQP